MCEASVPSSQSERADDPSCDSPHLQLQTQLTHDDHVKQVNDQQLPVYAEDAVVPSSDVQQEAACRVFKYLSQYYQ